MIFRYWKRWDEVSLLLYQLKCESFFGYNLLQNIKIFIVESSERNQKASRGWKEININKIRDLICSSVWINGMLAFTINVIFVLVDYWLIPIQTG